MSEPLRVLWVIKGLGPGGAERLLVAAARVHDPERVRLAAVHVLDYKDHLVTELRDAGVATRSLGVGHARDLRWVLRLRRLLRGARPDVVHVHSPLVAAVTRVLVRTLPRAHRPALVSTEHNAWPTFAAPTRWVNAATHRLDDARFAVSEEVRRSMQPRLAPGVRTLTHGIELAGVRERATARQRLRDELGIPADGIAVATVANHTPQKAYPVLLAAAGQVVRRCPEVRFLLVGQGPLLDTHRRLHAELALDDRVRLLGYRADAVEVLAASDVFCLASDYEGLPVAMMEALALGLPVVATAVGGVAETIVDGTHGRLVPPGAPDALAEALAAVIEDEDERRRMAAAAAVLGDRFDIAVAARVLEDAYTEVAGSRRGS